MYQILAPEADFLSTPWGMAAFIIIDVVLFVLIAAINYRWFFKRFFDILFSGIFLIVFLPFFLLFLLADVIYNKVQNAYKTLFVREYFAGKREDVISLTVFATERIVHDEKGALLPEEERITKMGRVLRACGMKYYPCLLSVFSGKMSFVGPRPLPLADAAALDDAQAERFSVRPGLVSSLEKYGGESLTYPDMFEEDAEYVRHVNLFRDIGFFCTKLINRVRGESMRRYGECGESTYIECLLRQGKIDAEEAKEFYATAKFRTENYHEKKTTAEHGVQRNMLR